MPSSCGTTSASCVACPRGIHGSSCPRLRTPRSALSSAGLLKEGGRLASFVYAAEVESLARRGIKVTNIGAQPDARRLGELSRMVDAGELTVSLERTFSTRESTRGAGRKQNRARTREDRTPRQLSGDRPRFEQARSISSSTEIIC